MTPVRPPHTPDPLNLRGPLDGPRWRRAEPAQSRRPGRSRPGGAPLRYHRTGVGMSRTGHGSRPVPPATTVGLALLAAAITLWLGLVAQFGQMITGGSADGSADSTGRVPDRLIRNEERGVPACVAVRVAPNAPTRQVADRIRELNGLQTPALAVGQTLIAPVG
ncbi:hypothetical protein J113_18890 [Mycobacterium tuberculosis CAS/NITR204]|uniref:LysM domain-containing protein n=1 Tax=Mycobacterium tuberculosis CAS/NITR204 TaxID=1310114 RepID=R4MBC8_MYCTX|nr:hypothetical protein J113_18890 [Mycobacterium tuberculosis CAS/NITR204]